MAKKRTWRRRAQRAVSANVKYHEENESLRAQLRAVDHLLFQAKLPGPSVNDWTNQARKLFQELIRIRRYKVGDGYALQDLKAMKTPPNPLIPPSVQPDAELDGTFTLPVQEDFTSYPYGAT